MSHPIYSTVTLTAAVANGIAQAQALPGASGLRMVLNGSLVSGGVATMDAPRRVAIASAGNDSGITFTVTGTRGTWWANTAISETVTGSNGGTAVTTQDFATVTSIVASGAAAGNVTVGTNGTGSGPWVPWDTYSGVEVTLYGVVLSGSPTWGVEYTYDDVFGTWLPSTVPFPRAVPFGNLTGMTTNGDAALSNGGCKASRLTLTAVGSVQLVQQQEGGA